MKEKKKKKSNSKYYLIIGIILIAIIIRFATLSSPTIEPTKIESKYIENKNTSNSTELDLNGMIAQLSSGGSFIFIISLITFLSTVYFFIIRPIFKFGDYTEL